MTAPRWVPAFPLAELSIGDAKLFRHGERQIAVFRLGEERLHAVDNRCPHEGYPLVQGLVRDCVLTCAWHNYKFDLRDGRCLLGEEGVRVFPVRVVEGQIEVDVAEGDPAAEAARLEASLESGLLRGELGQVARDGVRLLRLGVPAEDLMLAAVRFDAERAEYGTTHVLPLAADLLRHLPRWPGTDAVLPWLACCELAAEAHARLEPRPAAAAVDPGPDPGRAGQRLRELVEAEEGEAAEALLRGALQRGWSRPLIEPWFLELCSDHFLDFGHPLIYTIKAFDFLEATGFAPAPHVLPALLRRIVVATREDTLPPWRPMRARLGEIEPAFPDYWPAQRERLPDDWDRDAFVGLVLDGKDGDAFAAVEGSVAAAVPVGALCDALVIAASERIGRFDPAHDRDPSVQDGWLSVTHLLTFANAVRYALERWPRPRTLRQLFFAARFVNKARPLDAPAERRGILAKVRLRETLTDALAQITDHVRERRTPEAVSLALKFVARGRDADRLRDALLDLCLEDGFCSTPIFVAHAVKTTVAAFDELEQLLPDKMASHPILAAVRFLASPRVERFTARQAHDALRFVVEGKVPRVLAD